MQLGDYVFYIVIREEKHSWVPLPKSFDGFDVAWGVVISINKDTFLLEKPGWFFYDNRIVKKRSELFSSRAEVYNHFFKKEKQNDK